MYSPGKRNREKGMDEANTQQVILHRWADLSRRGKQLKKSLASTTILPGDWQQEGISAIAQSRARTAHLVTESAPSSTGHLHL